MDHGIYIYFPPPHPLPLPSSAIPPRVANPRGPTPPPAGLLLTTSVQNTSESGDTDAVLSLQGVGWFIRKTIGLATVTLNFRQYNEEDGTERVDIDQAISPGFQGTQEQRALNWEWRDHKDIVFGQVKGRSRWIKITDLPDDDDGNFMRQGWDEGTLDGGDLIQSYVESLDKGWTADQTWGFELVNGVRKYTRHVIVKDKSKKKILRLKIHYDYAGPAPGQ